MRRSHVSKYRLCSPVALALSVLAVSATPAAADQTGLGPWNADAARMAAASPLASSAMAYIKREIAELKDPAIRRETEDAVFNLETCVKSRIGITAEKKQQIVDQLVAEGLIDPTEAGRIPGGLIAGVFPGIRDEATPCPKLPEPYYAAPGSVFGGHHSEPGGLSMHVAVNLTSAIHLADTYRKVYGNLDAHGMPVLREGDGASNDPDLVIDQDVAIGTPIWHDWAKSIVFQWNADGSEYTELNFGGAGKNDAWGGPGNDQDRRSSPHRASPRASPAACAPTFIIAQASAHGAPPTPATSSASSTGSMPPRS